MRCNDLKCCGLSKEAVGFHSRTPLWSVMLGKPGRFKQISCAANFHEQR